MGIRRRLRIPADVTATIRGLHPELKRKVRAALEDILHDPGIGKALRDDLDGLLSCRVLRFRIIYRASKDTIDVVALGPRRTIYQETWLRLRKTMS